MEAFTENQVVVTRTHGGGADSAPLNLGSLAGGAAIATPTALAGTVGVDCKLIKGDRWQQIVGNETDTITKNLMTTIDGDENRLLLGSLETTIMQKTKDDRFGMYLGQYFAPSTFNYFHQRIENHTAEEQEHQPTGHNEVINQEEKKKIFTWLDEDAKCEKVGAFAGLTILKAEALPLAFEGFGAKGAVGGIDVTGVVWKNKAEALETSINGFFGKLTGASAEGGGPETDIRPVFIGILVAVHIDSPFA